MWNVIHKRALLIREPNEVRILRLVRDSGEISRSEIAKATSLHKASITDYVVKLIKAGFLKEVGKAESAGEVGRRRIMLRFRPRAGLVAGVDIRKTSATVAITDLNACILQQESFEYSMQATSQKVLEEVAAKITKLLRATISPQSQLVGIGIGIQGVIDYSTNTLLLYHNKRAWQGDSLSTSLEEKFDVPVYVENDVKTMTLGEYLLGTAKAKKEFVHIWVGDGLGAGIMINGHLLHGVTSSAGEIGYNGLDFPAFYRKKFPLTCRNQIMFGEVLTDANFIVSYRLHAGKGSGEDMTVAIIVQKARDGDSVALQLIEEFASLLSILCINIVNTLNPEMIVVGGELARCYPPIAEMLEERIHKDLLVPPAEAVRVRTAMNAENGVILGAVGLVLYELFEPLHTFSSRTVRQRNLLLEKEIELD